MSHYEKPKGQPKQDEGFAVILREFYWRLFVQMMIPALMLGFIFWLPTMIFGHLPDRLTAQCTTYNENIGVRIVSETERYNVTEYYWTNNSGETWGLIMMIEVDYQSARANCESVIFAGDITQISLMSSTVRIDADGFVMRN